MLNAFLISAAALAGAEAGPAVATARRPAQLVPTIAAAARCSAQPQVVVTLVGFTPPTRGHASLVVLLRTQDGRTERLGEAGVFPEQAFAAPAPAQHFGFALPAGALARRPQVIVEVSADDARGTDARAVIGSAEIVPAPQEHC
jgi:hypothetical protein